MIQNISPEATKMLEGMLEHSKETTQVQDPNAPAFKDLFTNLIDDVDNAQEVADKSIDKLASGESTSIQDVVMKMEEADVAFKLMKEVRDKLMSAYKEVMSMQS